MKSAPIHDVELVEGLIDVGLDDWPTCLKELGSKSVWPGCLACWHFLDSLPDLMLKERSVELEQVKTPIIDDVKADGVSTC